MNLKLIIALMFAKMTFSLGQTIPDVPCPQYFQYDRYKGQIIGRVQFPNLNTDAYNLKVTCSVRGTVGQSKLALIPDSNFNQVFDLGKNPQYILLFPIQDPIPKITQIQVNNNQICSAPEHQLLVGTTVSSLWATSTVRRTGGIKIPQKFTGISNPFEDQTTKPIFETGGFDIIDFRKPGTNQIGQNQIQFGQQSNQQFNQPQQPNGATTRYPTHLFDDGDHDPFTFHQESTSKPSQQSMQRPIYDIDIRSQQYDGPQSNQQECGVYSQSLVVGGDRVREGEFPWLVAIFQKTVNNYQYKCAGNLISKKHVLSAAHCFRYLNLDFPKEDFSCVLGKLDITNWARSSNVRKLGDIHIHPKYEENTADYDVSVVTLDRSVDFSDLIRPICLWSESDETNINGLPGTVVGWGSDEKGKSTSTPNKVEMAIVSNEECLRSHFAYASITSPRTFCAGGEGVGPCKGDSGAGFVIRRNGLWTIRGIVSVALKVNDNIECDLGKYVVFADVKKLMSWISTQTTSI